MVTQDSTSASHFSDPAAFVRKVGKGRTLLKSLDRAEAAAAFALLLRGAFTDAQAGAFLQALRIKELSPDELDGLLDAFRALQPPFVPTLPAGGFVLNLASDTQRKGGYASLLAAAALAREGLPVGVIRSEPVLTGNRASWEQTWNLVTGAAFHPPKSPRLPQDTPEASGEETAADAAGQGMGCEAGCDGEHHPPASLCVLETNDLMSALRSLRRIRAELGFRSCLHTAEKMLNPWAEKPLVLGISHRHYAARMCDHFARHGRTARIVLGNHGTPDLVLHKETEVWEVLPGGTMRTVLVHPEDLGLAPDPAVYTLGAFPQWAEEWRRPGHGRLGPVVDYHLAFFRYVTGAPSGALVPRPVAASSSPPQASSDAAPDTDTPPATPITKGHA